MLTRVDPRVYIELDWEKIPRLGKSISRPVKGKGGAPLEEIMADGAGSKVRRTNVPEYGRSPRKSSGSNCANPP
jgi:hypothetical protein